MRSIQRQGPVSRPSGRRLAIVAVVGDFPAVSKTFVVDQLVGLARAGHRLQIIAEPPREGEEATPEDLPRELHGLITYRHHLSRSGPARLRRRFVLAVARGMRTAPFATMKLLWSSDLSLYHRMRLLELMVVVAEVGDPDVFHCHFGPLGTEIARVREALGFRGRIVTAFHGYDISSHLERQGPEAFDHLFEHGELFLPISQHWRDRITEIGAPQERVQIQRMGVDVARLGCVTRPGGARRLRILSVGRLVEKKGFVFGLRAVAELRDQGVDVEYAIVGDGPERKRLETVIDELELGGLARLAGARSRDEVHEMMCSHDVLLCPSVTASDGDSEGIPIVLMEAMATGMPVVSTFHSGIPELVHDGSSGLLAEEGDVYGLAERLRMIQRDPGLAVRLAENGRKTVESKADVDRLVGRLEERLWAVVMDPQPQQHRVTRSPEQPAAT